MSGLLIVNADDWGGFQAGTDAIETCFQLGAISSTTAMVYMADSKRAAELARANRRPTGLHLNLTQGFDARDVAPQVRERQRRLRAHFSDLRRRRWRVSPDIRVHRLVADGIRDQLEEFRERYRGEPTHIDSHHHVHVCPDVFLSSALAPGLRVRQTLSPPPTVARRNPVWSLKRELLAWRFITTARFWRARETSGGEESVPIEVVAALARDRPVEVMVHPSFSEENRMLRSDAWLDCLGRAPLGPYSALLPHPKMSMSPKGS
ncbi:MAG: ChbG/HpnK family deacetylase [Solirubrobacteraceae bacterium]